MAFQLLHYCVVVTVSALVAIFSSLSFSLFIHTLISCTRTEGLPETISLPSRGSGKVCVHSTLPRPLLWDFTGYVVVVVYLINFLLSFRLIYMSSGYKHYTFRNYRELYFDHQSFT
uniref:Putative ovule protein n=1 Tax=Solanum chacoense TaxID=4108 RepID=A0A0V0HMZ1_SOLCH